MVSMFLSAKMILKVMLLLSLVMAPGILTSFGEARQLVEKSKAGGENENRETFVEFSEIKEKKHLGDHVKTLPPFPNIPFVPPLPQIPQLPFPFPFPLPPSLIPKLPFPIPPFPFPIPPISFPFPPSIPKPPILFPPIIPAVPPLPESPLAPSNEQDR